MEEISWRGHVRNVGVLHGVKQRRGMSYIQRKKNSANLMGAILCRNCLLKRLIIGKIEG
jgi:hypothetical protein